MRKSDLRALFRRQAASELPPATFSIPAMRRIGRARLFRRRAATFGSPVLAAAAVVAVLAGVFAAGPRQPTTVGGQAAPTHFNPLVPYAALTWYPFQPTVVGSDDWRTALLLEASSNSAHAGTQVMFYAAGWCTLQSSALSCGSTAGQNRAELTVTGRALGVQGRAAYWARFTGGNLPRLRLLAGITQRLVFQYAGGGWAVVESTGTQADLLRVAASVRYGQNSALRFPYRLTGLPSAWSDVLYAASVRPAPGVDAPSSATLLVGSAADRPGTGVRDALTVFAGSQTIKPPTCQTKSSTGQVGPRHACPSKLINGYRAFLNSPPVRGKQTLFVADAGGLYVSEQTIGPDAPLSPASVLAHHVRLLGPDPASWTTSPLSP